MQTNLSNAGLGVGSSAENIHPNTTNQPISPTDSDIQEKFKCKPSFYKKARAVPKVTSRRRKTKVTLDDIEIRAVELQRYDQTPGPNPLDLCTEPAEKEQQQTTSTKVKGKAVSKRELSRQEQIEHELEESHQRWQDEAEIISAIHQLGKDLGHTPTMLDCLCKFDRVRLAAISDLLPSLLTSDDDAIIIPFQSYPRTDNNKVV